MRRVHSSSTGGDPDLAIEGLGYLEVTLPSGISAYTRDGGLKCSADGEIVTSDGYALVPGITIPPDARTLAINAAGEVYAYFDNVVQPTLLGQFTLAGFANEKGLEAMGSNLFLESGARGLAQVSTPARARFGNPAAGLFGRKLGRSGARNHRADQALSAAMS